jgi:hypothetical protein
MRRLSIATALATAALLAALAVPAAALPLPPASGHAQAAAAPVVIGPPLGRRLIGVNLESGASLVCSAQGERVDTNGNGLADSLRGRAACKENSGVARLRIYSVRLQSDFADTWATALVNGTDAVSGPQPSYVVSHTPTSRFCPPPGNFNLTYRVRQAFGIRSLDGSLAGFTMNSYQFQARAIDAAQNDVC